MHGRSTSGARAAWLAAVFIAIAAPIAAAPQAPAAAGVPVEREPCHHVVFENGAVKVIDARLPVGVVTLYHTHSADNVPVVIRGGRMTVQPLGGTPQPTTPRTGDASVARGGYTHQIANVGAEPLHFLDVEIHATGSSTPARPLPDGHTLVLDDVRVRLLRHVAGHETEHVHDRGRLAIVVPPGHDASSTGPAGGPRPGEYWWIEAGASGRPVPAGTEVVEIENQVREPVTGAGRQPV